MVIFKDIENTAINTIFVRYKWWFQFMILSLTCQKAVWRLVWAGDINLGIVSIDMLLDALRVYWITSYVSSTWYWGTVLDTEDTMLNKTEWGPGGKSSGRAVYKGQEEGKSTKEFKEKLPEMETKRVRCYWSEKKRLFLEGGSQRYLLLPRS